jgi:pimeloyl-ACP methyl ester carboxylesterase
MPQIHAQITASVLLIWGAADPTFPVVGARQMVTEFPNSAGLIEIRKGKLLVHEEFPEEVARAA